MLTKATHARFRLDIAGGGFADQLAQRIAKAEARTFPNVGHSKSLRSFVWPVVSADHRSLLTNSRSGARRWRAHWRGLFEQEKAPPKRGQVLVSLLHSLAGGHPAVSIMPGATMCSARAIASSRGTSTARTTAWRLRAWPRSRASGSRQRASRHRAGDGPVRQVGLSALPAPPGFGVSSLVLVRMDLWGTPHHGTLPCRTRWRSDRASEGHGLGSDESR